MNSSDARDAAKLVLLCKAGDDDAFENLINLYKPMLVKCARDLSLDEREVYSDACFSLRRAAQSYRFDSGLTFGLYAKICVSRAMIDYAKRNKDIPAESGLDIEKIAVSDGVQNRLEREEERLALEKWAKSLLSELELEVFLLTMRGNKTSEIAEKLALSAKSVDNAKARIIKRLRAEIDSAPKN